jgi:hypothetical protein
MISSEEYLTECMEKGEIPQAIAHLKHKAERIGLSKILSIRANREEQKYNEDELCLFENAVESFFLRKLTSESALDLLLQDAFAQSNRRAFEIILDAYDFYKHPNQNKHGTIVVAAIRLTLNFLEKNEAFPTKLKVKQMVEKQLAYDSYGIDESGKWANIFKDAGLRFLPDGKPWDSRKS